MIAKCPHCGNTIDTAKVIAVPPSPAPVDHTTKRPIDVTKESHVLTGHAVIDKSTVRESEAQVDPKTGKTIEPKLPSNIK